MAMMQRVESAGKYIESRDAHSRGLTDRKRHAPQLEQVRSRSETEIRIDTAVQVVRSSIAAHPSAIGRSGNADSFAARFAWLSGIFRDPDR